MNIGIFDPYLDSLRGGEKYMLTIAACLSSHHKVSIFWDLKNKNKIIEGAQQQLGIDLSNIEFDKNIFSKDTSFFDRFLSSRKYDRIIILSDGSIPFVWSKLIVHFQSPIEWVNTSSLKSKAKVFKLNKVICNSLYTKSYIDKKFNISSTILYPPIEISKKDVDKKQNIILNVGRYGINWAGSSYKKQDVLIEAFKKLIDDGLKNWEFILIVSVSTEHKESLNSLIQSAKGYPIKFIENPLEDELWKYYTKAKIYWHASGFGEDLKKYPDRAEHFGISTVEAMSMRCVPIVINAGGQKEIVENNKNGFLWDSVLELQEKTLYVIKNEKVLSEMGKLAAKRATDFSKDKFCKEISELVQ